MLRNLHTSLEGITGVEMVAIGWIILTRQLKRHLVSVDYHTPLENLFFFKLFYPVYFFYNFTWKNVCTSFVLTNVCVFFALICSKHEFVCLLFINFYRKNSFVLSFYPIFFIVRQIKINLRLPGDVGRVSLDNFWMDLDPPISFWLFIKTK